MTQATDILRSRVWESGGAHVMARITGSTGGSITTADVTTITRRTFDLATGVQASTTVLPSTAVLDAVATDARWTVGGGSTLGYNFRDLVSSTVFADGDKTYRLEYQVAPTTGETYWFVAEVVSQNVRSN